MENKYTREEALELGDMIEIALEEEDIPMFSIGSGFSTFVSGASSISKLFNVYNCIIQLIDSMMVMTPDESLVKLVKQGSRSVKEQEILFKYIFDIKFEDLPLGINKKDSIVYIICNWRLKIGR